MKLKLSISILTLLTILSFGQEKKVENGMLYIEFLKAKKVSNTFNLNSSSKVKSNELKKISVKCKIESLNKVDVDINKFSLIDNKNKLRYRPIDVSFQPSTGYIAYKKLLKTDIKLGSMYMHQANIAYKPEIKDSYTDYYFEGYTNIEIPSDFGTNKKPKKTVIYFQSHGFHDFKSLFFFAILNSAENPDLELYYGNEKISKVKL
ncbi:hypothetical protein WJN01_00745 [Flavobacteriaceae bacterium SZ-1-7]|uniref:hypothetical protein n=1 Tax=Tamlana sedimenti TaxID=3134126 RepID=UPI00312ACE3F